jgi:hypothetical protein
MIDVRLSALASAALLSFGMSVRAQAQQQAPQSPNMTFFVTSAGLGKGGDLGGIEGADRQCQQLGTAAGAGNKTWHAYLSSTSPAANPSAAVHARDRIGKGPWQNFKGTVIATSVDDLHSDNNKLARDTILTERGTILSGVGYTPVVHDIVTGSQADGRAWPPNLGLTCNNWTSSQFGSAMLGHSDRLGLADTVYARSWNATHMSRGCSQDDLRATGGGGSFYCFAAQ